MKPIEIVLHCPSCHTQHVDLGVWATRLHRTHKCAWCGFEWRPCNLPTVGVAERPPAEGPQHCGDCGVVEGDLHKRGCDVEHCPFCGGQLIGCGCRYEMFYPDYAWPSEFEVWPKEDREHGRRCADPGCARCEGFVKAGLTHGLPTSVYMNGLPQAEQALWEARLEEKGRVPYIFYPFHCGRCGEELPPMFMVPDEEWERTIEKAEREKILCRGCYDEIRALLDAGARRRADTDAPPPEACRP